MASIIFKLFDLIKRKAPESNPGDPQASSQKKRKTADPDPFRPNILNEPRAGTKRSSGDPQLAPQQVKKRKTIQSDTFKPLPSNEPQIATKRSSEGPQLAPQQTEKRGKNYSDIFRPLPSYEPSAGVKRSFEDAESGSRQTKKRKTSGFDPSRLKTFSKRGLHSPRQQKPGKREHGGFPMEIWGMIMTHCDLPTISTLASTHRKFASWVEPAAFWKERNKNYYGSTRHPPPPPAPEGTTERQYAELIEGSVCMRCSQKCRSSKPYWAFSRRWCDACFEESTIHVSSPLPTTLNPPQYNNPLTT